MNFYCIIGFYTTPYFNVNYIEIIIWTTLIKYIIIIIIIIMF